MNSTWNYWGNTCCKFRKHNEYLFITSAVSTLILTVLFYVLTQLWAKKKLPTIIERKLTAYKLYIHTNDNCLFRNKISQYSGILSKILFMIFITLNYIVTAA